MQYGYTYSKHKNAAHFRIQIVVLSFTVHLPSKKTEFIFISVWSAQILINNCYKNYFAIFRFKKLGVKEK